MTGISYLTIHLLALLLPGWVIVRLSGFNAGRPVLILAGSYIYYVLLAALSKWLDLPLNGFFTAYGGVLLAMALISLRSHPDTPKKRDKHYWLAGLLLIVLAYSIYRYLVGPYTEVPADFLRHLEFAQAQLEAIYDGHLGKQRDIYALLNQRGGLWYSFYALISYMTGLEPEQSLAWATYANSLVFLICVYSFAWYVFEHFQLSPAYRLTAALLATLFMASHLGLNVFAYLRYYALAPTMLSMVVYFAAVIVVLELLRWRAQRLQYGLYLILALLTASLVHTQEALFILVMGGLMLAWFALYPKRLDPTPVIRLQPHPARAYRVMLLAFILGFFALAIWTYFHHPRPNEFHSKIIQVSQQGPFLNRLLFLNPTYQVIQAITVWGILVYALWLVYWRKFIGHPYLYAGMLAPVLTVFNPVFVDWFMRMDGVHTLWRMLYITPLHFVAALLVVSLLSSAHRAGSAWKKAILYFTITLFFTLLLPLNGLNSNSRLTLARVDNNDSYTYWQDLLDYLNQPDIAPVDILTDPVTAYMLKGLTRHRTYHRKFFDLKRHPFNFTDYSEAPLAKYKGWWLVVNDRNGGISQTGERSGHWPRNILNTSSFYSAPLREHIRRNTDKRFKSIWEQGNIHVYEIQ